MAEKSELQLTSPAFGHGGAIPTRHTGEGEDISPALAWSGLPQGTQEIALTCDDPDAPMPHGWVHWVVAKIPAAATGIEEGDGSRYVEGANDFGGRGYGGPMPPPGHGTHHYYFWIYALDVPLDVQPGITRADLLRKMEGHILAQARLIGTYER